MYYYILPFLVYILTISVNNNTYLLILRVAVLSSLLFVFRKFYKFRLKLELLPIFIGFIIFFLWVMLEGLYPILGKTYYLPQNTISLIFRTFSFIVIAPAIEEYFTRSLLARILINKNWKKVALGKFTLFSFTLTTLFFGFSHNRWLPGLIAGALLNYVIYKKKNMGSVFVAHSTANLLLAAYIIYTKSWFFW